MAITAAQINELRKATGAGMLDCKKALEEVGGDMEQAIDYLRKKGLAAASKKAGRAATEGMVATAVSGNAGVLVEINSETDFVAKNDKFQDFVKQVVDHVLAKKPATLDELLAQPFAGDSSKTVQTLLTEAIAVIGENMQIRRFATFTAESGAVGSYIHAGGKIGVLVEACCDNAAAAQDERLATFLKDVAMHIAAASPLYVQRSEVPADVLEREKEIYRDKARQTGKPENIIEKIIEGQVNKFYGDICLLEQAYVKDPDKSVQQYLAETAKALGGTVTLKQFAKFVLGEGLEKKETDFAAEVAAVAGQ
ncbi:translation elongation factor Ts [Trichlorobacter ammonificans]|uniref:Elongation factor Ts n=1 Tax=Trichlorobacter ammonificans TaxID=2916410 RepID=A0ABM9D6L0_9BACT|nr:translation elongation factor Ts [Trichlorobacter ammonificans]CAH2030829.1 protein chain elongation factor EF-Ts [Trichlorobacter ammonificans]